MNYKYVLGIISLLILIVSFIPYFRDIYLNRTKPHTFTWLIWGTLSGISFTAQISNHAAAGAWASLINTVIAFGVFFASLKNGKKSISKLDKVSLIGAASSIIIWLFVKDAVYSVIIISLINILGFIPTFRKSLFNPYQETLKTYALSATAVLISILAINKISLTTLLYPLTIVVSNFLFVFIILIKRTTTKIPS